MVHGLWCMGEALGFGVEGFGAVCRYGAWVRMQSLGCRV